MPVTINDYLLKSDIEIRGIQGIPIYLDNTMFLYLGTGAVLSTAQFPTYLNPISQCTAIVGGGIIATGAYPQFSLVAGHPQTISGSAKYSIRKPISISNIKSVLGVSLNSLDALNKSSAINQQSPYKPNPTAPNSLSE